MPEYTLKHFNPSADKRGMEDTVNAYGGIEVKSYDCGKLTVIADQKTMESFENKYRNWFISPR